MAAKAPSFSIQIREPGWRAVPRLATLARGTAKSAHAGAVAAKTQPLTGAVTLAFAGDAEIVELNTTFRGKKKPTNVLSFPDRNGGGDIMLAWETVAGEAADQNKTVADHTTHLIVHAVLHLMGYDHLTQGDAGRMERLERSILAGLGIADPYVLRRTKSKP